MRSRSRDGPGQTRARHSLRATSPRTPAERKFDTIILNEVLYYFQQPGEILIRFGNFLEPNGSFLVSLWESDDSRRAWKRSESLVDVKDSVRIAHSSGVSWTIRVCRPRKRLHEAIHGESPAYASGHSKN
ncbi:methyltransferase domain-containing protein [Bradyrhizobium sp. USDA 4461]